jgi:hypothetical protein
MSIRNSKGQFTKKVEKVIPKAPVKIGMKINPVPVEIRKYIDNKFDMLMNEQRKFLMGYFVQLANSYEEQHLEWD